MGQWSKCHQILMNHLFADRMFEECIDGKLENALSRLAAHSVDIIGWRNNGAIIYEYIRLIKSIHDHPESAVAAHLSGIEKCKQEIDNGESNDELKKRVCLMTMCRRLDTCVIHLSQ